MSHYSDAAPATVGGLKASHMPLCYDMGRRLVLDYHPTSPETGLAIYDRIAVGDEAVIVGIVLITCPILIRR